MIQTSARERSQSREEKVERARSRACLLSRARLLSLVRVFSLVHVFSLTRVFSLSCVPSLSRASYSRSRRAPATQARGMVIRPVLLIPKKNTIFHFSDNSFNNGGKFLAFQQGIESCNERNCQYGGVCTVDSSGQSLCQCNIYCTRQYDPVCGTDGNTYNNPCLMRVARCQFQSDITRLRYGQCGKCEAHGVHNKMWLRLCCALGR